jgi:hypothetical protein
LRSRDGRERLVDGRILLRAQQAILRVDHFEPGAPLARFAETGDPHTGLKLGLLAAREMEEAQGQLAAAVADAHQEVAATAERRLGEQHLARHQAAFAGDESAQPDQLRAVFVAQR